MPSQGGGTVPGAGACVCVGLGVGAGVGVGVAVAVSVLVTVVVAVGVGVVPGSPPQPARSRQGPRISGRTRRMWSSLGGALSHRA